MEKLVNLLNSLPATRVIGTSADKDTQEEMAEIAAIMEAEGLESHQEESSLWWVKLDLDIRDHMAWHVVQELGFVLNYISLDERLPTVFMPVSAPPYMNGGPDMHLEWVIESTMPEVDPGFIAEVLEDRLPTPVTKLGEWAECEQKPCRVTRAKEMEGA